MTLRLMEPAPIDPAFSDVTLNGEPITAAFGRFDEGKHPRVHAGEKGGGRFTVKENAAGRFEVVNQEGTKVAETTDAVDAQTVADEKNAAPPFEAVAHGPGDYSVVDNDSGETVSRSIRTAQEAVAEQDLRNEGYFADDQMISRRVKGGYNEQQSRELLDQIRREHSPTTIGPALAYHGFVASIQPEEPCQECIDIVAAIPVKPPTGWFDKPELDGPTPITVTSDGQIYGHAAIWGTCHLGNPRGPGVCVEPPHSRTGYELFHLGEVETDDGVRVAVGNITLDTGHAPMGAGARTAAAHYDDTGTVIADVVAGEDEHGLWFAGALRSDVTPETVRKFTGSKISGDWRSNELVGMLCVNVPGFPVPRARARLVADAAGNEEVLALVAAGIVGEQPPSEREIEIRVATLCARVEGIDALADLALA